MRERRDVKFKLDIYDDTKTKIIDQRPERDFIHYFFARSIILAGKADCEGKLYMGKDIPYTIETLAIEFNRDAELVKLALDVLIELKMIEVTEDNIYRVKGFVKHQNIKIKEEDNENCTKETRDNDDNKRVEKKEIKPIATVNKEVGIKEDKQIADNRDENIKTHEECGYENNQVQEENEKHQFQPENYKTSNKIDKKERDSGKCIEDFENEIENKDGSMEIIPVNKNQEIASDYTRNTDIIGDAMEEDNLIVLEIKDNKKFKKKKKSESGLITEIAVDEIEDDSPILVFSEGDMPPLGEGERLVWGMSPI